MVVELLALGIAVIGAFAAGLWDLKTSDVPDEITTLMGILGVLLWFLELGFTGNPFPLLVSLIGGTVILLFGWLLYRAGAWGGGDAKLFAAIFYLMPSLVFYFSYIVNLLFVAIIYLVIYSLVLGFRHTKVFGIAKENLKKKRAKAVLLTYALVFVIGAPISQFYGLDPTPAAGYWILGLGLILFWAYARAIEKGVFKRTIPAKQLKVGDVLASSKRWIGITEEELAKIKKSKRTVEVKEGVRFTLAFAINIVVTIFLGNLAYFILF